MQTYWFTVSSLICSWTYAGRFIDHVIDDAWWDRGTQIIRKKSQAMYFTLVQ